MGDNGGGRLDRNAQFVEFCKTGESLNKFCKRKKISLVHTHAIAKAERWFERRKEMEAAAVEKAVKLVTKEKALDYARHIEANEDLLHELKVAIGKAKLHKKTEHGVDEMDENGQPKLLGLDADQISKLASALEKIVKVQSFMLGGPSERTESKALSLHADITQLIDERRQNPG